MIVKGLDDDHGLLLKQLNVDRVIYPKIDAAAHLGDQLTWPNILDSLPIDQDYSFVEIAVPDTWSGQSLVEVDLRRRFGIWVIGVKDTLTSKLEMFPGGDLKLTASQFLLVVGKQEQLSKLTETL